jgi:hypothetical protein
VKLVLATPIFVLAAVCVGGFASSETMQTLSLADTKLPLSEGAEAEPCFPEGVASPLFESLCIDVSTDASAATIAEFQRTLLGDGWARTEFAIPSGGVITEALAFRKPADRPECGRFLTISLARASDLSRDKDRIFLNATRDQICSASNNSQ